MHCVYWNCGHFQCFHKQWRVYYQGQYHQNKTNSWRATRNPTHTCKCTHVQCASAAINSCMNTLIPTNIPLGKTKHGMNCAVHMVACSSTNPVICIVGTNVYTFVRNYTLHKKYTVNTSTCIYMRYKMWKQKESCSKRVHCTYRRM